MTDKKGTPLPWNCDIEEDSIYIHKDGKTIIYFDNADEETEGNARLIIEAVNNHDALVAERDELRTVLSAWYDVFGTTQLTHAKDKMDVLVKENAELKRNWLSEPHEPMDEGFWGRSAARLQMDNVKLSDAVGKLRSALQSLYDIQNGPPLTVSTKKWNNIMDKSREVFYSTEGLERKG